MKIYNLFFIMIFYCLSSFSQSKKDTVYIYFENIQIGMKKDQFKTIKSNKYPNEIIKTSYSYLIDEKTYEDINMTDSGYTFTHYNWDIHSLEYFNLVQPLKIEKDIAFLRTVKPLDINFFLNTSYIEVCKIFEKEDSREIDVVIFMIDKDEIKKGKLILREVKFSRPEKI